jgi:hypothetical protein
MKPLDAFRCVAACTVIPWTAFVHSAAEHPRLPEEDEGAVNVQKALAAKALVAVGWPTQWRVFGPIQPGFTALAPEALTSVPETVKVDGVEFSPRTATAQDLEVNLMFLMPPGVAMTVPLAAYCFGEFDSPMDGTLYVNMAADWKTEWVIDGKRVYSTMEDGNQTRTNQWFRRGFAVPVTKGRHTVALLCQRHRWDWHFLSLAGVGPKPPEAMREFFQLRRTITPEAVSSLIEEDRTLEPAPPLLGTETETLIAKVKAPARFAKYVPRFHVEERWGLHEKSFTEQVFEKTRAYHVYDGDRLVASFVNGAMIREMNPLAPWNVPERPDRGFRYINLSMADPLPLPATHRGETRKRYCVAADGSAVTWERSIPPSANAPAAWESCRVRATLRVDPLCGYVVDVEPEFASADAPSFLNYEDGWFNYEWFNVMPSHLYYTLTKPVMDWRYERTMYCNRFTDKYRGWVTDEPQCQASDNAEGRFWGAHGLPMRDGGFVAFAKDPQGWSLAASRRAKSGEVEFYNMTCHLLQDQHNQFRMRPPAKGKPFRLVLPYRMMNLPPEVTDYLLDRVEMYLFDFIMLRRGEVRDFESDARRENEASPWSPKVAVAEGEARSGRKAAAFRNADARGKRMAHVAVNLDMLPVLEYGKSYRLEGWVKVQGEGAKAWFSIQPPFMDDKYWRGPKLKRIEGAPAVRGDGWQKITVEFTNHDWHGWSLQPQFRAEVSPGGAVYLDDLLVK